MLLRDCNFFAIFREHQRWSPAREAHVAESGRVHAHGENTSGRSNARVAKNGDPRLKTEQRQGMQRVAAHLAVRSGRQPTTASPAWRARIRGTHGDGLTTRSSRNARVRYGKVAPIIVAYLDNAGDNLVDWCNVLLSAGFRETRSREITPSCHVVLAIANSIGHHCAQIDVIAVHLSVSPIRNGVPLLIRF